MNKHIRGKKILTTCISIITMVWVTYRMWTFREWPAFSAFLRQNFSGLTEVLVLVFFLMFINLGLETRRWQLLVRQVASVPFSQALKQVIKGIQLGLITPARTGDPLGKAACFASKERPRVILLSFAGSILQNVVIFAFTLYAIALAGQTGDKYLDTISGYYSSIDSSIVIFSIIILILMIVLLWKIIAGNRVYAKITKAFKVFRYFTVADILYVGTLTLIRYLVFSLQFIILLRFFGLPSTALGFIPVFLFYGAITFLPSLGAGDVGIRSAIALFIFGETAVSGPGIVLATMFIWFFNIALPAVTPALIQPVRYSLTHLKSRYYRTPT
ncbi:MAG: hypothetical protein JG782_146 [Anaerophaga sp.]|uniref:hypothetical protein n=1 Tax=Anaerophaga thermohalophila TaxID=177400 RepID=UPI000237C67C|nr:hypothetical protein [Anaerophaga thermohalophila]MBZ4675527.1 hypothetical protein [Anaerophaga sp.]MDK2842564.1 hypothetical protein [Anaerophaga sp.]MDN5291715.1 hypothetical protein [Anaerophaga sp.]